MKILNKLLKKKVVFVFFSKALLNAKNPTKNNGPDVPDVTHPDRAGQGRARLSIKHHQQPPSPTLIVF